MSEAAGGGEFGLIRELFAGKAGRVGGHGAFTRLGIGDDGSLHRWRDGFELAVSADAAIEGVHWPADFPLETAADKAACAALSDLAAMGARPLTCWLTAMARDRASLAAMAAGVERALRRHRVELAGGDTSRAPVNALSLTVAGEVPEGEAMLRGNARPGQSLWLAGRVGLHALGLREWMAGAKQGGFVPYFQEVQPLLEVGQRLRELGVRCCIDVSDGLVQDAAHVSETSGVTLEIEAARLPGWDLLRERAGERAALEALLAVGEDYALLFTADEGMNVPEGLACPIWRVLEAGERRVRTLLNGEVLESSFAGYDHFA